MADSIRCAYCGKEFTPRNRRAEYCSDPCRAAAYRRRHSAGRPVAPRSPRERQRASEDRVRRRYESHVAAAVVRLRGCAHELNVLSSHESDSRRSNTCYRLAQGIMKLLEGEGLA